MAREPDELVAASVADVVVGEVGGGANHMCSYINCILCAPVIVCTASQLFAPRCARWSGWCDTDEPIHFTFSASAGLVVTNGGCCNKGTEVSVLAVDDIAGFYIFQQVVEYVTSVGDHVALIPRYQPPWPVEDAADLSVLKEELPGCEDLAFDYCLGCDAEVCNCQRRSGIVVKTVSCARLGAERRRPTQEEGSPSGHYNDHRSDSEDDIVWLSRRIWRVSDLKVLACLKAEATALFEVARLRPPVPRSYAVMKASSCEHATDEFQVSCRV